MQTITYELKWTAHPNRKIKYLVSIKCWQISYLISIQQIQKKPRGKEGKIGERSKE
jgi:hypothetical protein